MNTLPDISALSSLLGPMMSDPDMLTKIMSISSALKESGIFKALSDEKEIKTDDDARQDDKGENDKSNNESSENSLPEKKVIYENDTDGNKNRIALIRALKPFLSPEKREKAEMLLAILSLLAMLSSFRHTKNGKEN